MRHARSSRFHPMPDTALRTLLAGSIDYAGLFPPAGLRHGDARRQYAEYRRRARRLGARPVRGARGAPGRARARGGRRGARSGRRTSPWRLSALLGADVAGELEAPRRVQLPPRRRRRGRALGRRGRGQGRLRRGRRPSARRRAALGPGVRRDPARPRSPRRWSRPSPGAAGGPRRAPAASRRTRSRPPAQLLRFLRACTEAGVPFKATAGLHHPLRAEYRLTYAPDSPRGTMFGFLNVFLAAAFLRPGCGRGRLRCSGALRRGVPFRPTRDGRHRVDRRRSRTRRGRSWRSGLLVHGAGGRPGVRRRATEWIERAVAGDCGAVVRAARLSGLARPSLRRRPCWPSCPIGTHPQPTTRQADP